MNECSLDNVELLTENTCTKVGVLELNKLLKELRNHVIN